MTEPTTTPLTLLALSVQNFKRLKLIEVMPSPTGLTVIRGRNNQGKTSTVDAWTALVGGKGKAPARPIRDGEETAVIRGDFGNLVVTRKFTDPTDPSKTTLIVENENGARLPRPQETLEKYLRERIDPVRFMRMKPADQVQDALQHVDVPLDLSAHAAKIADAETARRDAGREVKRLEGAVATLLPKVAGAPEHPIDVSELAQALADAERVNQEASRLRDRATAALDVKRHKEGLVTSAEERVAALRAELEQAEKAAAEAREYAAKAAEAARDAAELAAHAETVDPEPIQEKIRNARALNEAHAVRKQYLAECTARDAAVEEHEALDRKVKDLRQERLDALNAVNWPHQGLGYDPDANTLTLHGVPFEQASGAQKLIASADIAMARPGAIRVLTVDELGSLDREFMAMLDEHLRAHQFQMIGALVSDDVDGPGIVIEDGAVRGAEVAK